MGVLIVGAGPTGLTTAVELNRLGVPTTILDRRQDPSTLSRAVGILPRSLEILEASGITERLLASGIRLHEVRIYDEAKPMGKLALAGGHPRFDFLLALAQDRTEAVMREVLESLGGEVMYGTELVSLEQDDREVRVRTRNGQLRGDYLVAADGVGSTAGESLGVEYHGYDLPEKWSIADVDVEGWRHPNAFTICRHRDGRVAVVAPIGRDRCRVVSNTPNALETLPLDLGVTRERRRAQFSISVRQAESYRSGRVFLAGDAAHCHSPVGGRGMNLGIADGATLARCIAAGRLDSYPRARHPDGATTIRRSERARRFMTAGGSWRRVVLSLLLGAAGMIPPLRRRIARGLL